MESFLIVTNNTNLINEYIKKLCQDKDIADIDISIIENEGTIGIAEVRNLQKTLFFAPIRGKAKAVVIKNAQKLTIEAQNSLLKILEEPPNNTIIILATENKELLLPTILSRCKIIQLPNHPPTSSTTNILVYLQLDGVGNKLALAERLAKDKKEAIKWLENMILSLRQELLNGIQVGNTLKSFQQTYIILKTTNANPRLVLENLFLGL